jgi:hypothetical protein
MFDYKLIYTLTLISHATIQKTSKIEGIFNFLTLELQTHPPAPDHDFHWNIQNSKNKKSKTKSLIY